MAQSQAAYPPQSCPPAPTVEGYPPPGVFTAPPPPGYPGAEYAGQQQSQAPGETTDRGVPVGGCLRTMRELICCCCGCLGEEDSGA